MAKAGEVKMRMIVTIDSLLAWAEGWRTTMDAETAVRTMKEAEMISSLDSAHLPSLPVALRLPSHFIVIRIRILDRPCKTNSVEICR
jgi:hypothetical protein